jgi:hypothetical protein
MTSCNSYFCYASKLIIMRILLIPVIALALAFAFGACKSSSAPQSFCDTACLKDTLKFTGSYKLKPYVYISAKNCKADTLIWSYNGMGVNRKVGLSDFLNTTVHLNKNYVRCYIKDTSYAWVLFNDCSNGRGYSLKLPFNKTNSIGRNSSSINNLDPKFSVADNIAAYTDRGNIYVEDMQTRKKAMMTFGKALDIDYDAIHEYIDSVNVTNNMICVKVKIDNQWKELEKKITLE